jgi:hypothetical protein
LFQAHTVVDFADRGDATQLDIAQTYTILDPSAERMIEGAAQGWSQTLDRLEQEVARIQGSSVTARFVVYATFCIERTYDATRSQVFRALIDPVAKAKWFAGARGIPFWHARWMCGRAAENS